MRMYYPSAERMRNHVMIIASNTHLLKALDMLEKNDRFETLFAQAGNRFRPGTSHVERRYCIHVPESSLWIRLSRAVRDTNNRAAATHRGARQRAAPTHYGNRSLCPSAGGQACLPLHHHARLPSNRSQHRPPAQLRIVPSKHCSPMKHRDQKWPRCIFFENAVSCGTLH